MVADSNWLLLAVVLLLQAISPALSASIADQSGASSSQVIPRWSQVGIEESARNGVFGGLSRTPAEYSNRFNAMFQQQQDKTCSKCGEPIGRNWLGSAFCGCLYHHSCLQQLETQLSAESSFDDPRCPTCANYLKRPDEFRIQIREIANLAEHNLAPDESCPICHGELADDLPAVQTICGHVYHDGCLRAWERRCLHNDALTGRDVRCPMCRQVLLATNLTTPN